ncbi:MAG: NAD(P)H-hydrate dehydratase [Caldiserica bacterium]|nr:NAD(P)H-hydrate dehydratase [Caldisericota bacterium]
MKVSTVDKMRKLDKQASETYGVSELLLMENAGNAAYFAILEHIQDSRGFIIFCGPGNNGGDGLVVARKIYSSGGEVKVYLLGKPEQYKGAARLNYEIAAKMGFEIKSIKEEKREKIIQEIRHADIVVDAILGTGLTRAVEGTYAEIINLINHYAKRVLSLDIPSGINGNNGNVMGTAIKADYTVTFGLPKLGNILYPGYDFCGELYVSHISFPPQHYNQEEIKIEINEPVQLPARDVQGHKGTFGDILFVAGARGYYGAPYFAALSFLKAGGGYSRLATPKSVMPHIGSKGSEIVFLPLEETESGSIAKSAKERIMEIARGVDMVVIGPGLSLHEETQELVGEIVNSLDKPLLIDGDGLTAISREKSCLAKRESPTVLTPHPGEIARIKNCSTREVIENKIDVLREVSRELKAITVLKGAHTLIGYPEGEIFVNMSGNSGMATAGSGDVLTGTIAAMYGLGLNIKEAVRMGVFVHGASGDLASWEKGEDGITAQDILDYLPKTMKILRENFEEVKRKYEIKVI